MSCPMSSLVNPQNPNQVMVYYLTQHQSPGLELYDVGAQTTSVTRFTDNLSTDVESKIVNPGSFSALISNGLINLYGLIQAAPPASGGKVATDASATKRLAQLSPVYKLLFPPDAADAKKTNNVIGIAMTTVVDAKGQSFMYCMTGTEDKPRITEFSVGWSSSKRNADVINSTMDTTPPLLETNLAAVFDPATGKKLIVYQNTDNLHIVESTSDNDTMIPNTDDSLNGTGLALVPVTVQKDDKQVTKLYLYYFPAKGGKLQRIVRDEDGTWQKSGSAGDDAFVADPNSFLTATQVGNNVIMVYYMLKGKDEIHSFRDTI